MVEASLSARLVVKGDSGEIKFLCTDNQPQSPPPSHPITPPPDNLVENEAKSDCVTEAEALIQISTSIKSNDTSISTSACTDGCDSLAW